MQSTTSSTRTFQSSSTKPDPKPPKRRPHIKLPKLPKRVKSKPSATVTSAQRWPWLIVLALVLVSLFLFDQYHVARNKLQADNPAVVARQVNDVIAQVRKLVVLPADEKPTVATVQDAAKLRHQTFFAHAVDGDKVLIYSREKEAILYRPSTNQIVTIAPVNPASTGSQ